MGPIDLDFLSLKDGADRFGFLEPLRWGRWVWISLALKMGPIGLDFFSLEYGADRFGFLEP